MFGTKWPSITSKCITSAPASSRRVQSLCRLAKSADKIEAATFVMIQLTPLYKLVPTNSCAVRTYKGIISHYKPKSKAAASTNRPQSCRNAALRAVVKVFQRARAASSKMTKRDCSVSSPAKSGCCRSICAKVRPRMMGQSFLWVRQWCGLQLEFKIPGVLGQLARQDDAGDEEQQRCDQHKSSRRSAWGSAEPDRSGNTHSALAP